MANTVLLKSPLHEAARQAGAHFMEFAGWEIADHYGDPQAEHLAVRSGAGMIDLSHRGKIRVEGEDRISFLHSMLSNDVKSLQPGEGLYAAMLNAQGHMVADLYLYCFKDHFLIDSSAPLTRKIPETLERYIIMERVALKEVTGAHTFIAVEGPQAAALVSRLAGSDLAGFKANAHAEETLNGIRTEIFRCSLSGETGFAVLADAKDAEPLWHMLLAEGKSAGLRPFGRAAANTLRIEAGIPWYGADMDEGNLPQEAGIGHAVSVTKGCYIGQEVMARLDSFAKVKKKLIGLAIFSDQIPAAGSKLFKDGGEAGYLTSAALSPVLAKTIGLGYVRLALAKEGNEFEIDLGERKAQARVTALPFVSLRKT